MENISDLYNPDILGDKFETNDSKKGITSRERIGFNAAIIKIINESNEHGFQYLKSLNFHEKSELLILPSNHHYFYDEEDLKSVKILINLKKLNQIKHPYKFLQALFSALPPNASFIGCFSDDKTLNKSGAFYYKPSRILNRFINFIDSKTDHILDTKKVSELLNANGFKIVDMKEIYGITYFYSCNIHRSVQLRA